MEQQQEKRKEVYFRATIVHSKETYLALTRMQYQQFGNKFRIFIVELGTMLILAGVLFKGVVTVLIFVFIGCWLIASVNYLPVIRAERMLRYAGGKYPKTEYYFYNDVLKFCNNIEKGAVDYHEFIQIAQDVNYFYLYLPDKSAHMIPKEEIQPNHLEVFEQFLYIRTGLTCYTRKMMLSKIMTWLSNWKNEEH